MLLQVALGLAFLFLLWKAFAKPENYPPGPWGVPLIGYPSLSKNLVKKIRSEMKKYPNSPLISWRMGSQLVVFILDYRLLKESYSGKQFLDRPIMKVLSFNGGPELGLIAINGEKWQRGRRFTLHHLRNLGMGKSRLGDAICEEAKELVKTLLSKKDKSPDISYELHVATANIIWQLVASKRFSSDDKDFLKFEHIMQEYEAYWTRLTIVDFMPWIKNVLPGFLLRKIINENLYIEMIKGAETFLMKDIDKHIQHHDPNDPQDYIDEYLIQMKKEEEDPLPKSSIKDLIATIYDLLRAGTETSSYTLHWAMTYLCKYPKVQKRMQEEIDNALPNKTPITMEDKSRLPYTEAVIYEVHRHCCLVALGVMHLAAEDTKLAGYTIPKGTIVTGPTFASHFDSQLWDSPEDFRPERFLDGNGNLFLPKEGLIPFGTGKRQCLGEPLAKMELIIFLTTLVQNIHFEETPGKPISVEPADQQPFLNSVKHDQEILMTPR